MGLGVGWHEGEHRTFGVDYPSLGERFDRLDEYIQVMQAMWGEGPASFDGRYYRLREADVRPKPEPGRPTVLIAGGGEKRTLPLVAKHAHEWNCVDLSARCLPAQVRAAGRILRRDWARPWRDPAHDDDDGPHRGDARGVGGGSGAADAAPGPAQPHVATGLHRVAPRAGGAIMGAPDEIVDRIGRLAEAGIDEIDVHLVQPLVEQLVPDWLASNVLPQVKNL